MRDGGRSVRMILRMLWPVWFCTNRADCDRGEQDGEMGFDSVALPVRHVPARFVLLIFALYAVPGHVACW